MTKTKSNALDAYVGLLTGGLGILVLELIRKMRGKK